MKITDYVIVDADKCCWAGTTEEIVTEAFNENDGILPMKLIKINLICKTPVAQEINVIVPDEGDTVVVESVETKDG